ncbi:ATP-binding cassette, subfamily B [Tindallia californiensis]|uniref:ATP-binding cassette, subfamily B n=1 Tax=Tindallia californiensis TaxID=159292 RepID=A0A1H3QFA4_9FIRM|nr:ATP-binding cassette, subfamily B [Tindallia californiensis]
MINAVKNRFALSHQGALDFIKGTVWSIVLNIALMLPVVFTVVFLEEYLNIAFGASDMNNRGVGYYLLLGIGFMAIMFWVAIFQYKSTFVSIYDESANRRITLAEKLRRLPLAFFSGKNLSDLTATIMEDSTDLEHTFSHAVPQLIATIISVHFMALGLMFYHWPLALALLWVAPFAIGIILLSKKIQLRSFKTGYRFKRNVSEQIQEGLETIQEIKSYNREKTYLNNLYKTIDQYESQLIRGELVVGGLLNIAQSFLKLGLVSVIIVGAKFMAAGSIDLFTYLIFLMVASRIYSPLDIVLSNLAVLFYLDVRIKRMREMEALPAQSGKTIFDPENYDITFKNVDFSYHNEKQVIKQISFTAKQGEITALVGPSGGGKSTATKLAARFWDTDKGKILLGGYDIKDVEPETLLKSYSVVFQEVVLFNASIRDNIKIGKMDATEEEIMKAAKLAQCHDFVHKLSKGYDTVVGENGETLSGGERQRISIARALLKDAPIVLLDEATASLDAENETKIQVAISELTRNKTVLMIAHRMRTVANADKIIVLENGSIVESGNHEELLSKKGVYSTMWQIQQESLAWSV